MKKFNMNEYVYVQLTEYGWLAAEELAHRIVDMTEEERKTKNVC